jgi:hypothetical protein
MMERVFKFPPSKEHVNLIDDEEIFKAIQDAFRFFIEDPNVIASSSRLVIVAPKNHIGRKT